ncbi:unnamed protein product [Owenia fusiformis]|uniref:Uncharacterized protein n=1 Tax=Owenia fusiformis TaxID=6347 RepID=A0A8J1YAH0_OWEFU|nr:unnamed protein product [Owenia fusiformis]
MDNVKGKGKASKDEVPKAPERQRGRRSMREGVSNAWSQVKRSVSPGSKKRKKQGRAPLSELETQDNPDSSISSDSLQSTPSLAASDTPQMRRESSSKFRSKNKLTPSTSEPELDRNGRARSGSFGQRLSAAWKDLKRGMSPKPRRKRNLRDDDSISSKSSIDPDSSFEYGMTETISMPAKEHYKSTPNIQASTSSETIPKPRALDDTAVQTGSPGLKSGSSEPQYLDKKSKRERKNSFSKTISKTWKDIKRGMSPKPKRRSAPVEVIDRDFDSFSHEDENNELPGGLYRTFETKTSPHPKVFYESQPDVSKLGKRDSALYKSTPNIQSDSASEGMSPAQSMPQLPRGRERLSRSNSLKEGLNTIVKGIKRGLSPRAKRKAMRNRQSDTDIDRKSSIEVKPDDIQKETPPSPVKVTPNKISKPANKPPDPPTSPVLTLEGDTPADTPARIVHVAKVHQSAGPPPPPKRTSSIKKQDESDGVFTEKEGAISQQETPNLNADGEVIQPAVKQEDMPPRRDWNEEDSLPSEGFITYRPRYSGNYEEAMEERPISNIEEAVALQQHEPGLTLQETIVKQIETAVTQENINVVAQPTEYINETSVKIEDQTIQKEQAPTKEAHVDMVDENENHQITVDIPPIEESLDPTERMSNYHSKTEKKRVFKKEIRKITEQSVAFPAPPVPVMMETDLDAIIAMQPKEDLKKEVTTKSSVPTSPSNVIPDDTNQSKPEVKDGQSPHVMIVEKPDAVKDQSSPTKTHIKHVIETKTTTREVHPLTGNKLKENEEQSSKDQNQDEIKIDKDETESDACVLMHNKEAKSPESPLHENHEEKEKKTKQSTEEQTFPATTDDNKTPIYENHEPFNSGLELNHNVPDTMDMLQVIGDIIENGERDIIQVDEEDLYIPMGVPGKDIDEDTHIYEEMSFESQQRIEGDATAGDKTEVETFTDRIESEVMAKVNEAATYIANNIEDNKALQEPDVARSIKQEPDDKTIEALNVDPTERISNYYSKSDKIREIKRKTSKASDRVNAQEDSTLKEPDTIPVLTQQQDHATEESLTDTKNELQISPRDFQEPEDIPVDKTVRIPTQSVVALSHTEKPTDAYIYKSPFTRGDETAEPAVEKNADYFSKMREMLKQRRKSQEQLLENFEANLEKVITPDIKLENRSGLTPASLSPPSSVHSDQSSRFYDKAPPLFPTSDDPLSRNVDTSLQQDVPSRYRFTERSSETISTTQPSSPLDRKTTLPSSSVSQTHAIEPKQSSPNADVNNDKPISTSTPHDLPIKPFFPAGKDKSISPMKPINVNNEISEYTIKEQLHATDDEVRHILGQFRDQFDVGEARDETGKRDPDGIKQQPDVTKADNRKTSSTSVDILHESDGIDVNDIDQAKMNPISEQREHLIYDVLSGTVMPDQANETGEIEEQKESLDESSNDIVLVYDNVAPNEKSPNDKTGAQYSLDDEPQTKPSLSRGSSTSREDTVAQILSNLQDVIPYSGTNDGDKNGNDKKSIEDQWEIVSSDEDDIVTHIVNYGTKDIEDEDHTDDPFNNTDNIQRTSSPEVNICFSSTNDHSSPKDLESNSTESDIFFAVVDSVPSSPVEPSVRSLSDICTESLVHIPDITVDVQQQLPMEDKNEILVEQRTMTDDVMHETFEARKDNPLQAELSSSDKQLTISPPCDDPELIQNFAKAQKGSVQHQNIVGEYYLNKARSGASPQQDGAIAVHWLILASMHGHSEATKALQQCLQNNIGITQDNMADVKFCVETPEMDKLIRRTAGDLFKRTAREGEEKLSTEELVAKITDNEEEQTLMKNHLKDKPELSEGEFVELVSRRLRGVSGKRLASDVEDDSYSRSSLWEKLYKHPMKTCGYTWSTITEIVASEGIEWLMIIFPIQQMYLIFLLFLVTLALQTMGSFMMVLPLFVFFISFIVMVIVSLQMFINKRKIHDVEVWLNILKRQNRDIDLQKATNAYAVYTTKPYWTFLYACLITIVSLGFCDRAWIPCSEFSVVGLVLSIAAFAFLAPHDTNVHMFMLCNLVSALSPAFRNFPDIPVLDSIVWFLTGDLISIQLGEAVTFNMGIPSLLYLFVPILLYRMAVSDSGRGFYNVMLPQLVGFLWLQIGITFYASSSWNGMFRGAFGWPVFLLFLPVFVVVSLIGLVFFVLKLLISASFLQLVCTVIFMSLPVVFTLWSEMGFTTDFINLKNMSKRARIGLRLVSGCVFTLLLLLATTPSVEKEDIQPLSWNQYEHFCGPRAWESTNMVQTQVQCGHFRNLRVRWTGTIKSVSVNSTNNYVQRFVDILPSGVGEWVSCMYGEKFDKFEQDQTHEEDPEVKAQSDDEGSNNAQSNDKDAPEEEEGETESEIPAQQPEFDLTANHPQFGETKGFWIGQNGPCHVRSHDEYVFKLVISMSKDDSNPHDTLQDVVLFALDDFRDVMFKLNPGDEVSFVGKLKSGLGGATPVLNLKSIECISCNVNLSSDDNSGDDAITGAISEGLAFIVNFFTRPVVEIKS